VMANVVSCDVNRVNRGCEDVRRLRNPTSASGIFVGDELVGL
jgi:hypothetical protein